MQILSPEKWSEIYDEQYNILKRKLLAQKAKKEKQLQKEHEEAIKEGKCMAKQRLAEEMGCSLEELESDDEDLGFPLQSSDHENDNVAAVDITEPPSKKSVWKVWVWQTRKQKCQPVPMKILSQINY